MAAEVEGAARKPHNSTFTGNGLQYNYDAELAAVLPFNVKIPFDNITEARRVEADGMAEQLRARAELPKDPNVLVEDHVLPGTGGSSDLPIRIYTPARRTTSLGALVFFHGGGYVLGTLDNEELRCVHFAARVNCVVVSPDYRLAPEHPFPAAFDDCYRTLCWLAGEGPRLGVDVGRIAVGGISSGGGLAASVAQRARVMSTAQILPCNFSFTRLSTPGSGPCRMPGSQTRHYGTPIATERCGTIISPSPTTRPRTPRQRLLNLLRGFRRPCWPLPRWTRCAMKRSSTRRRSSKRMFQWKCTCTRAPTTRSITSPLSLRSPSALSPIKSTH